MFQLINFFESSLSILKVTSAHVIKYQTFLSFFKLIYLLGSLGIAASFLYFTGPWSAVAAALLPLLDTIFKLVDKSVPKSEESEEELIDR